MMANEVVEQLVALMVDGTASLSVVKMAVEMVST